MLQNDVYGCVSMQIFYLCSVTRCLLIVECNVRVVPFQIQNCCSNRSTNQSDE